MKNSNLTFYGDTKKKCNQRNTHTIITRVAGQGDEKSNRKHKTKQPSTLFGKRWEQTVKRLAAQHSKVNKVWPAYRNQLPVGNPPIYIDCMLVWPFVCVCVFVMTDNVQTYIDGNTPWLRGLENCTHIAHVWIIPFKEYTAQQIVCGVRVCV